MSESDSDIILVMKRKSGVRSRSSSRSKARLQRRATTFRLEPRLQRGLELLSYIRRAPLNRLVNEAVDDYLDVQAARLETDLEATLQRVKAYRAADPDFEHAIARFAEAEAEHAAEDPVEGSTVRARGSAQRLVRELIRG
jgi:predicted transcriptional regulator